MSIDEEMCWNWDEDADEDAELSPAPSVGSAEDFIVPEEPPPAFPYSVVLDRIADATDAVEFHPLGEASPQEDALTLSLGRMLLKSGPFWLPTVNKWLFSGSGVYMLEGPVPSREDLHGVLYIGKSEHKGRRKGMKAKDGDRALSERLKIHYKSVRKTTENLNPRDLTVRFIVLPPQWVGFAEHKLIELFQPVWNVCLYGFGNKPQGIRQRAVQRSSPWDTWYPNRVTGTIPRDKATVLQQLEKNVPLCLRQAKLAHERLCGDSSGEVQTNVLG
jgi:hypothetical protein